MFNKSLIVLFLILPFLSLAQDQRSVEVTGTAFRKILADQITLSVSVIPGERCVIPSGKNYQKYVKECTETNKQLVASRENILKGIMESYGNSIEIIQRSEVNYTNSLEYNLKFTKITDLNDFRRKLEEYKPAFKMEDPKAYYTKMTPEIFHQVRLESLLDARNKAESMAKALNESVGAVLNIYETKPGNMGGWMDFITTMMYSEGLRGAKSNPEAFLYGLSDIPDEEGYITCTASSFVRFALK